MNVQRYELSATPEGDGGEMRLRRDGGWVAYSDYEAQAAEIAEWKAKAEAAEANARRYLFIRDHDACLNTVFAELPDESGYRFKRGDELDTAIDAMRGGAE